MAELNLARDLFLILLAAFIGGFVAKKLKLPLLVGYLLIGSILGNFITRFFPVMNTVNNIAEIGVALLLFTLGLDFSLTKLKELGETIIFGSLIQVLLSMVTAIILLPLFGFDFYTSLFLGAVFALSSTAVALKTLSDKGELEALHGEISAGWLFMQDLYTFPLMILLPAIGNMVRGENFGFGPVLIFLRSMILAFISFFLIVYVGKRTIPAIFEKIADLKSRELLLIAAVSFCFLFAHLFQVLGFSFAIGAFIAGILLSSSSAHYGIFAEVRPLRDLFTTVFFVSLGLLVNPTFLLSYWSTILLLVVFVLLSKFLICSSLVLLLQYHLKTAMLTSFSLISVGEFAFILAVLGLEMGLINNQVFLTVISVSFLTLIIEVPLLSSGEKIYYQLRKFIVQRFPWLEKFIDQSDQSPFALTEPMADHVVVLGHGRVGKYIGLALSLLEIPYLVVDYNHHLVKSLRQQGVKVIYGDPAEIDVLNFARVKEARAVILAYADRHTQEIVVANILTLNPATRIVCRVHFEEDLKRMKGMGVSHVVQPEFEAALSMIEKLLTFFKTEPHAVEEKLRKIRKEHGLD